MVEPFLVNLMVTFNGPYCVMLEWTERYRNHKNSFHLYLKQRIQDILKSLKSSLKLAMKQVSIEVESKIQTWQTRERRGGNFTQSPCTLSLRGKKKEGVW